jgi:DNA polymerase I-like protein with 3'-5' exonuclease and polymerase domains
MFNETIYIIVIKNPFHSLPYIFVRKSGKSILLDEIDPILQFSKIISYGFENLIDIIRRKQLNINPLIFDIVTMKKLCVGKPKSEYNNNLPWDLIPLIGKYVNKTTVTWLKRVINFEIINPKEDENYQEIINNLMEGFINCFADIEKQLKSEEYNRYYDTEVKLYNIFLNTQKNGIRIDQTLLDKRIIELKEKYYFSIKKLELDYGFNSEFIHYKMRWDDISQYCQLQYFESEFDYNFWSTVDLLHEEDEFLNYLLNAHDSFNDYNELLKYKLDKYFLIYPIFDIVGTVTSRIQIISPGIQFIKKSNRDIFIPRENMIFLYADFSQFEPGILASFSGDEKFLFMYNKADVYEELSNLLFSDVTHRRVCKTLFLAFIYGMQKDKIYKLIVNISDNKTAEKGIKFFEHFKQIQEWKKSKINEAESVGYSKSYFGNYRYLREIGESSSPEKRWIPNQIIQGTASYIFKISILELYKNVSDIGVNFLIPMHDAILLEVPISEIDTVKNLVTKIFSECFTKVCPKIIPRISFDEFTQ